MSKLLVVSIILRDSSRGYGLYQIRSQLETHLTASETNKYLIEMTQHGLICPVRGGFNYEMTPKGAHFLKVYDELLKETPDGRIGNCKSLFSFFSLLSEFGSKLNRFFYRGELS